MWVRCYFKDRLNHRIITFIGWFNDNKLKTIKKDTTNGSPLSQYTTENRYHKM